MSEKLKGMRDLSPAEIQAMNDIADAGNKLGDLISQIELFDEINCDQRWLAIGRTNLQQGIMAIKRAIGQPENF